MFKLAGGNSPSWAFNVPSDPIARPWPPGSRSSSTRKRKPGRNSKVTVLPADKLTVCFNGLGRIVNQGVTPSDHIQQIDIDSVVAGEARPLRIIVDDQHCEPAAVCAYAIPRFPC